MTPGDSGAAPPSARVQDAADLVVTPRLKLRRFVADDIEWLDRLNADPMVMRHMGGPAKRADTETMLRDNILAYYETNPGLGLWVTLLRDGDGSENDIAGFHLVNHMRGETYIQVGYRLFQHHWGKGYATEMSIALLRYAYTHLKLPRVHAITDLPNVESQHVLLKSGLVRNGERALAHPSYARAGKLAWFERDARDWLEWDRLRKK